MLYHIQHDLISITAIKAKLQSLSSCKKRGGNKQLTLPQSLPHYQQAFFLPLTIRDGNDLS
jgi:hypothetical protein